jgi:hypothetical protein
MSHPGSEIDTLQMNISIPQDKLDLTKVELLGILTKKGHNCTNLLGC